ncbi:hypothetical protein KL918_005352 [Ogataea parapolymorpha]|uniref:Agmatinase PAH n=1 Tax=Ogataea parapolymorpha (strain ATCC 26012 / BCRC 20466 / JCM 22074 / NRRL Y-7560 / DL-1) TaxID=871575 RepID=W1QEE4_OGAPD|nr:Agmatinase PAH [Ogataea parapolymorpha DL-1]ESW99382.1 Agmatinase PAH [Ogataea parapolymorpha DL-1]KAG7864614.1 hypothetical protein KL918_005352 [Ogataea parapolymorpha]KAG7868517.1 hypothetical protein KL916_005293 [Ogataea parapolymorpha]
MYLFLITLTFVTCAVSLHTPKSNEVRLKSSFGNIQGSLMHDIFGSLVHDSKNIAERNGAYLKGQLLQQNELSPISFPFKINQFQYPDIDDLTDFKLPGPLFSGIVTFAHLPENECFFAREPMDIAIVGAPFDLGVSYNSGARFGPNGARQGSRRLGGGISPVRGNSRSSKLRRIDPYNSGLKLIDCGDVPMTPFDSRIALNQLYRGHHAIHKHPSFNSTRFNNTRIVTLGGDHTITLMNLRSAYETFGDPGGLAVIHFDAHIDTWDPKVLGGGISDYASLNHGTFLHFAAEAGYVAKNHSVHVGIRAPFISGTDEKHDAVDCGFKTLTSKDVDLYTAKGIAEKIKSIVGQRKVYLTFDLDTFDVGYINSGTLEAGGLSSREILTILDGLEGIKLIGCDVVEVSTAPNTVNSASTELLAAQVVDSMLGLMTVFDQPE